MRLCGLLHVVQVEFVSTSDYEASKAGKAGKAGKDSSWGSWFGTSKSSSKQQQKYSSSPEEAADIDIVVEDQEPGPGSFAPFLPHYKTLFSFDRHQQLLSTAGWA